VAHPPSRLKVLVTSYRHSYVPAPGIESERKIVEVSSIFQDVLSPCAMHLRPLQSLRSTGPGSGHLPLQLAPGEGKVGGEDTGGEVTGGDGAGALEGGLGGQTSGLYFGSFLRQWIS
jgi:hypothetical protein